MASSAPPSHQAKTGNNATCRHAPSIVTGTRRLGIGMLPLGMRGKEQCFRIRAIEHLTPGIGIWTPGPGQEAQVGPLSWGLRQVPWHRVPGPSQTIRIRPSAAAFSRNQGSPEPIVPVSSSNSATQASKSFSPVSILDSQSPYSVPSLSSMSDSMDFGDTDDLSTEEEGSSSTSNYSERGSSYSSKSNYEVVRLDTTGRTRKLYVRRRDLLKEYRLQPRDLRRIDPLIDFTKTSPSITIKENVLLLCLGGVRALVTDEKALLFEPYNMATKQLLEHIVPHLQRKHLAPRSHTKVAAFTTPTAQNGNLIASHNEYMARFKVKENPDRLRSPPFELEVLEGALIGATGRVGGELSAVAGRVQELLSRLPADINPTSLEELRRVKAVLVELEDKADNLREVVEEMMDDEDKVRELNLSSRPEREERRRQRERDRLERELERAREIKEELEDQLEDDEGRLSGGNNGRPDGRHHDEPGRQSNSQHSTRLIPHTHGKASHPHLHLGTPPSPDHYVDASGQGYASSGGGMHSTSPSGQQGMGHSAHASHSRHGRVSRGSSVPDTRAARLAELRIKFDRDRLANVRSKFQEQAKQANENGQGAKGNEARRSGMDGSDRAERLERVRTARAEGASEDWISRLEQQLEGSEEDIQEAQEALEEMVEAEEEEEEIEEVEELLEYYLQRTSATQSEAERLLEGARDLEESIGVSLSARRYEVNRLELTLSIASFAAALGAMLAGIFGMNMRSNLEMSLFGFWSIGMIIVFGCVAVFISVMRYVRQKRIL